MKSLTLVLASVAVALIGVSQAFAAAEYSVIDTGISHAQGMNNYGQVVGWQTGGVSQAVYTDRNGVLQYLDTGGLYSEAYAINDLGQIAGYAYHSTGGASMFLYDSTGMHDLGVMGVPHAINNLGQIVGDVNLHGAFIYDNTGFNYFGPYNANDINDLGQVVGQDGRYAYLYDANGMHNLGHLGGFSSTATCINNDGLIVGYSAVSSTQGHPFIYNEWGMQDLGFNTGGAIYGNDTKINSHGQIITTTAWGTAAIFRDRQWVDLNTLIDPSLGWLVYSAVDINDSGQILVWGGTKPGYPDTNLILTPVPEPSTIILLGMGIVAILAKAWRRKR